MINFSGQLCHLQMVFCSKPEPGGWGEGGSVF